ncbi:MAG: HAD family hydrolase [Candidatus Bathyarchaeota archaeon]|nr:MAG: HAD family hydrolase [Candidatus Bathyarchaeota archaeon]
MPPNCANEETSRMVILFDLEGTLVQSIENDQKAILEFRIKTKEKLMELGIPPSKLEDIRSSTLMRNKALDYVEEHFSERDAKRFHLEMDRFQKSYELRFADRSKIFQDTLPALRKLKTLGYNMGLVTNTSREAANRILLRRGIETFFEVVVTREDMKRLKPDPGGIILALKRLNAQDFVFVGDLVHDSRAAENAAGVSIIVKRPPSKKLTFQANYFVRSLQEIPDLILHFIGK